MLDGGNTLGFVTCNKRFCADGEDALPAESACTANGNKAYNDVRMSVFGKTLIDESLPISSISPSVFKTLDGFSFKTMHVDTTREYYILSCKIFGFDHLKDVVFYRYTNKSGGIPYYVGDFTNWIDAGLFQHLSKCSNVLASSMLIQHIDFPGKELNFLLSKAQTIRMDSVRSLQENMGMPGNDIMRKLAIGAMRDVPFSTGDVLNLKREEDDNPHIGKIHSKMKHKDGKAHGKERSLDGNHRIVETDLFKALGLWFMISIIIPGALSIISCLNKADTLPRATLTVGPVLLKQMRKLQSYYPGCALVNITDNEGGIRASDEVLNAAGFQTEILSPDTSTVFADNRIMQIKDITRFQFYQSEIPCLLNLRYWCVRMANQCINDWPTKSNEGSMSASTAVKGEPLFYKNYPQHWMGFVMFSEVRKNTVEHRCALPGLFLGRADTVGSFFVFNILTNRVIRRSVLKVYKKMPVVVKEYILKRYPVCVRKMPIPMTPDDLVSPHQDEIASDTDIPDDLVSLLPNEIANEADVTSTAVFDLEEDDTSSVITTDTGHIAEISTDVTEIPTDTSSVITTDTGHIAEISTDVTEIPTDTSSVITTDTASVIPTHDQVPSTNVEESRTEIASGYVSRYGRSIKPNSLFKTDEYVFLIHMSPKKSIRKFGIDATQQSVGAHLRNLLKMKTFHAVRRSAIPQGFEIFFSHMFLTPKHYPNGEFEKLKARLVANRAYNLESLFNSAESSSPTVSIHTILVSCAVDAVQKRHVMTFDIGDAFLRADVKGDIYMRIDKDVADVLCQFDPSYTSYREKSGAVIVKLDKALFGCIESSKLFYDVVKAFMISIGFKVSDRDPCLFTMSCPKTKQQMTVLIHVDDGKASSVNLEFLKWFKDKLIERFQDVKTNFGTIHNYLGLILNYEINPGKCFISQPGLWDSVTEAADIMQLKYRNSESSPAAGNLFEINIDSPLVSDNTKEAFHSIVYKILWGATRSRPELGVAASVLAQRVSAPTQQDVHKLGRLVGYINGTKHLGLNIGGNNLNQLFMEIFSDASHGVYPSGQGHGGTLLTFGTGAAFTRQGKEKTNAKSSTESELMEQTNGATIASSTIQLCESMDIDVRRAIINQDNQAAIQLASVGRSTSFKTSHIRTRYYFIKMFLDNGDMQIRYTPTDQMWADILTKPLQGEKFAFMRDVILGYISMDDARLKFES